MFCSNSCLLDKQPTIHQLNSHWLELETIGTTRLARAIQLHALNADIIPLVSSALTAEHVLAEMDSRPDPTGNKN